MITRRLLRLLSHWCHNLHPCCLTPCHSYNFGNQSKRGKSVANASDWQPTPTWYGEDTILLVVGKKLLSCLTQPPPVSTGRPWPAAHMQRAGCIHHTHTQARGPSPEDTQLDARGESCKRQSKRNRSPRRTESTLCHCFLCVCVCVCV